MADALLISTNREVLPYAVTPLGIAYLAAVLQKEGYSVAILDLCFVGNVRKEIAKHIRTHRPRLIGLSVRNIDNLQYRQSKSYVPFIREIADECKRHSEAPIVLGGTGFSMMPDEIMTYCGVTYGVVGDGEIPMIRMLERVCRGDRIDGVEGLVTASTAPAAADHAERDTQKPVKIADLDSLPLPLRSGFDNKKYSKWGGMGNIQSKRGCASKCIYCTYPLIEGSAVRCRSPKSVGDELEIMQKEFGIQYVYFVDSVFNYPIDHALGICDEILKRKLTLRWSCYINPAHVTQELVRAMKKANCAGVEVGTDVASTEMLKNMNKNFTKDEIVRCSSFCRDAKLDFCHYLMLGGPGERIETLAETVAVMDQVNPTSVVATTGIRLYPRTSLYNRAVAEGVLDGDAGRRHGMLEPLFYISPTIGSELIDRVAEYGKQRPHWVIPSTKKNMPTRIMNWIVRSAHFKGPTWRLFKYKKLLHASNDAG